jgi:EAL domain-containing protein (putative c-di-GMP-specific phosphodiesterase class I)
METATRLADLIRNESVRTLFHPVFSVRKKALIGLKAVAAVEAEGGGLRPCRELAERADKEGLRLEWDRLARKKALEAFAALRERHPDLLLLLNIDTAIFDMGVAGSGHLMGLVEANRLDPANIVIEFTESRVRDAEALKRFLQDTRKRGFLIALDDYGSGDCNLGRMTLARPDIVKLGAALVREVDRDHYRREILRSFTGLLRKLGALVTAAGVRTPEEAVAALEAGVDMIEDAELVAGDGLDGLLGSAAADRLTALATRLKENSVQKLTAERKAYRAYEKVVSDAVKELAAGNPGTFDAQLGALAGRYTEFECLYVLDEKGVQLTATVFAPGRTHKRNSLFQPAQKGADHSSKDYFYLLNDEFVNRFTTEPYVSLASGTVCITITNLFRDAQNITRVLCADIPLP